MTKLSAPAPSPSVSRKSTGRYIDFVAKPKKSSHSPQQSHPSTMTNRSQKEHRKPIIPKETPELAKEPASEKSAPVKITPRQRHISPRGFRMDFVRRPANQPLPEVKVKKTVRIAVATDAMPQLAQAPKPEPQASSYSDPLSEPIAEDEELSLALADFAEDEDSAPSLTDRHSKEVSDLEDELDALDELDAVSDDLEAEIADFVDEPKPIFQKSKTPDANRFGLGGRSPFLSSVKVEKRPLSGFVPEEEVAPLKKEVKTPLKNAYRAKIKQVFKDDDKAVRRETTIISTPEPRAHTIGLAIAIILTIVLGALIGAVIYLVFFQ